MHHLCFCGVFKTKIHRWKCPWGRWVHLAIQWKTDMSSRVPKMVFQDFFEFIFIFPSLEIIRFTQHGMGFAFCFSRNLNESEVGVRWIHSFNPQKLQLFYIGEGIMFKPGHWKFRRLRSVKDDTQRRQRSYSDEVFTSPSGKGHVPCNAFLMKEAFLATSMQIKSLVHRNFKCQACNLQVRSKVIYVIWVTAAIFICSMTTPRPCLEGNTA